MKNTKRAARRAATFRKFNATVEVLFQRCTGIDTRAEVETLVRKRTHCEQTGRRFDGWKNWKFYATNDIHKREAVV